MASGNAGKGRVKGVKNKVTSGIAEKLAAWNCDPFRTLALIANGKLPCGVCRGKGKTKYQPGHSTDPAIRDCQSCWGSGEERISPAERGKAAAELCQYVEAKRKAIEVTGADGGPVEHKHEIVLVD